MVEARLPWISAVVRSWYPSADLSEQMRSALAGEAGRVGDAGFGQELRDRMGLDMVSDPLDWANRRIDLPGGGWTVAGVRFRGLDRYLPFVDVIATNAPETCDGLALLVGAVVAEYAPFAPRCLRVEAPDAAGLAARLRADARFGERCAVDLHVVAGLVANLRRHPRTSSFEQVRLRPGDPLRMAERASDIYRALAERDERVAAWANAEDVDSLTECAREALLFEVLADDGPAGVVAAVRSDEHAMTGFSVQELCLDAHHRGARLAGATLHRLLDELPARERDVLWGTIHPANAPSLRNALSIGRVPVSGYVWVVPAGLPGMPVSASGGPS